MTYIYEQNRDSIQVFNDEKLKATRRSRQRWKWKRGRVTNLSEVVDVVVGVGGLADEEVAIEEADLVEFVLVDFVIDDGFGVPALSGDEAAALDDGDVVVGDNGGGEEGVVLDVEVLLVVELLHFVLVHLVVVGAGGVTVVVVGAGEERVVRRPGGRANEKRGVGNGEWFEFEGKERAM